MWPACVGRQSRLLHPPVGGLVMTERKHNLLLLLCQLLNGYESSYFMTELYIYNPVVINQLQYPRKVYFVDTGFMTALSTKFSKNSGRLLENIVFQKLARENETLYYYKDKDNNEVDFAILNNGKVEALYQVCFDLTDLETQDREVRSIVKAGVKLKCKNLNLVTVEKPKGLQIPKEIKVITVAEFL